MSLKRIFDTAKYEYIIFAFYNIPWRRVSLTHMRAGTDYFGFVSSRDQGTQRTTSLMTQLEHTGGVGVHAWSVQSTEPLNTIGNYFGNL